MSQEIHFLANVYWLKTVAGFNLAVKAVESVWNAYADAYDDIF
jgi:hypothetical protein